MITETLPLHIGVVMDGNGRWAKLRGVSRLEGHRKGAQVALDLVKHAARRGIKYLTLYTFSSENWLRPHDEVEGLMAILYENLLKEASSLAENDIKLQTIGNVELLPKEVRQVLIEVKKATEHCSRLQLTLALSYGARDEIVRACKKACAAVRASEIAEEQIDEEYFATLLDTCSTPDPDLIIRTSGEHRLSNFLLWQSSYCELFFEKKLWPDFSRNDFDLILSEYAKRSRRFGQISAI